VLEGLYIEPRPLTPHELLEAAGQCRLVAYEALKEDVVLYAQQSFYKEAGEKLREVEERLKRRGRREAYGFKQPNSARLS